mgnify:CR=1 FL=1
MNFINKQLNKIKAFKKGKRVTISIPFKDLPKQTRDENEFDILHITFYLRLSDDILFVIRLQTN